MYRLRRRSPKDTIPRGMPNRRSELSQEAREAIGRLIRERRIALRLSQLDLAELAEIDDPTWIKHLESGPPLPFANVRRLARTKRVLGITWPDLLTAAGVWDSEDWAADVFKEKR